MKINLSSLLTVAIAAFSISLNAMADELNTSDTYYIQNVGSGLFMCGANNWGTKGSVSVQGDKFKFIGSGNSYKIQNQDVSVANKNLGSNLFVDNTGINWTISPVEGEDGVYTIYGAADAGVGGSGYIAQTADKGFHIGYALGTVSEVNEASKWRFLTIEQATDLITKATPSNPVDASFLIGCPNFSRNKVNTAWVVSASNKNMAGGSNDNMCAEHWQAAFTVSQTISVPNGKYKLSAQAALTDYANLYDGANYPVVYATSGSNEVSVPFDNMDNDDSGTNMATLSISFASGKYVVETDVINVLDGKLTIGVKGTRTNTWCIYDNFQLVCVGYNSGFDPTAYKTSLEKAVSDANAVLASKMNSTAKTALETAITENNKEYDSAAGYNAAEKAIKDATESAKTSVAAYADALVYINKSTNLDALGKAYYDADENVVSLSTSYNDGSFEALTNDVIETLDEVYRKATLEQRDDNSDMTGLIINNDFYNCAKNNFPGWIIDAPNGGNIQGYGQHSVEYWQSAAVNGAFDYYQTVTGLPAGTYKLTAKMWNSSNAEAGAVFSPTSGVYGTTGSFTYFGLVTDDIAGDNMQEYSTEEFLVTNGELRLGVKNSTTMTARWFGVDWIKLTLVKYGVGLDNYTSILASKINDAKNLKSSPMNSSVLTSLDNVINTYEGTTYSTEEEYNEVISIIEGAIANANTSIANYTSIKDYFDRADALDTDGQTAFSADPSVAEISAAYASRTIESISDEQVEALNAAYITAIKSQTTPNTDMTAAIINPSFETGDLEGWTTTKSDDTGAKPTNNNTYKMTLSDGNYLFNTWQTGYPVTQKIEGLKPGKYTLSAVMATDADQKLVLYLNEASKEVKSVDKGTGVEVSVSATVTKGSIAISAGTKSTYWYKVDNFKLIFNEPISFEDYYAQITELVDSANSITGKQSKVTKDNLALKIKAANAANGKERDINVLQTVINDLCDAITDTYVSIDEYVLGDQYNTLNEAPGSILADEEAVFDNWTRSFLGTGSVGDWHINTWSTEGETDGSEMRTPFLENWVNNGIALSDATFAHKSAAGLKAGFYKVSVEGRIYHQDGETPSGAAIFKVNDDYVNMLIEGTAFEHKNMKGYYGTYELIVPVKEGEDLSSSITISGVNFNWISFKNYKVEYLGSTPELLTMNVTDKRIKQGESVQLSVAAAPVGATNEVVWSSSDETIATVVNGLVTGHADGNVVITATSVIDKNVKATANITVAYPSELANATFDAESDYVEENIAAVEEPNTLNVTEWANNGGAAWSSSGIVKYGSEAQINGVDVPATDVNGNGGGALGVSVGWGGVVTYTQRVMLPAGTYIVSADAYNANADATQANSKLAFITLDGDKFESTRNSYPSGQWIKDKVSFTIDKATVGDIQVGLEAVSGGSGKNAKVLFDNISIVSVDPVDLAREFAIDAVNELSPIGDNIFHYSQSSIDDAINAINAAKTVDEVSAVPMPTMILPATDKAYQISSQSSGNYLSVTSAGIKLGKYSQPLYLEAVEGGYAISNGTEYVAYAGNNTWSLNAASAGSVFTISPVGEAYTIKGVNGHIGMDNANPGSTCYGNKAATPWTIAEFVPSEIEIADAMVIEPWDNIVADNITITASVEGSSTALINNGSVTANSVTLNIEVPNGKWSFVNIPCDVPVNDLKNTQDGTQWKIYKYDGAARANGQFDNAWVAVSAGETLTAGEGYIFQSRRGEEATSVFTFTTSDAGSIAKIFASADVKVSLNENKSAYACNAGWNLVGNPYIAYFDKAQMSTTAPITVWEGNNYVTYTVDDEYALAPFQAFFVQTAEAGDITFNKDGRQLTSTISASSRSRRVSSNDRAIYDITITDGNNSDRTRFVMNSDASMNYEIGRDASKFMSEDTSVPQIYTVEDNVYCSVNERPMSSGIVNLGVRVSCAGEYTISVGSIASAVVLEDKLTGKAVVLNSSSDSYTFTASEAGTIVGRFVINASEEATGIAGISDGEANDAIYTLQGVKVSKGAAKNGVHVVGGKKVIIK